MSLIVSPSTAQWSEVLSPGVAAPPPISVYLMVNGDGTYSITWDVTTTPIFELQGDGTVQVVA